VPPTATRVAAICAVFSVLILLGVYSGRDRFAQLRPAEGSGAGSLADSAADSKPGGPSGELNPGDPVMRFSDTRVGHLLVASPGTDYCRRMLFDNRTGAYYDGPEVFCGPRPDDAPQPPDRLAAMRKAFGR
jgi:hypothetical protein